MKKTRLVVLLFVPLFTMAQEKLVVKGKVKGLQDKSLVSIVDANKPTDTLASTHVKEGAFSMEGTLKEPMLVSITLGKAKNFVTFLDNSNVKMTGDIADVDKVIITGSSSNNDFQEFKKSFDPFFQRLSKINDQARTIGMSDILLNDSRLLIDSIENQVDVFILKHHGSAVSAFLLYVTMQLKDDIMLTDGRMNQLQPSAVQNMYGIYLKQTIAEARITAVGSTAIDFTQTDTLGNPVSLSSFRGKYVLLDFWASWCGPCRAENPNVVTTYNKFKDKNFTVLGVSLDRQGQKDKWIQAIHADNLTWTHVSDLQFWSNAVAQQYRVQSIPQNFLIGPDGKIVAKNLRGADLENKLCEILGCN